MMDTFATAMDSQGQHMEPTERERLAVLETKMDHLTNLMDEVRSILTNAVITQATSKGKWAGIALAFTNVVTVLAIAIHWFK